MIQEKDTLSYWMGYIKEDPLIRFSRPTRSYMDLICCQLNDNVVVFIKYTENKHIDVHSDQAIWHRLDGPAVIYTTDSSRRSNDRYGYWINNNEMDYLSFNKHPLVVEYKLNRLIKEVLNG